MGLIAVASHKVCILILTTHIAEPGNIQSIGTITLIVAICVIHNHSHMTIHHVVHDISTQRATFIAQPIGVHRAGRVEHDLRSGDSGRA